MKSLVFFFVFNASVAVYGATQITPLVNFGGGLNVKTVPSLIEDNESPDMSDIINDIYGVSFKRDGTKRFIDQAISSHPINSLFIAYASTSNRNIRAIIMTNKDRIYYASTTISPSWILISSGLSNNQYFSFAMMNNQLYMTGDNLSDPPKKFNLITNSMTNIFDHDGSTMSVALRAKHIFNADGYMLYGNVVVVSSENSLIQRTTEYSSRVYFSKFLEPSSVTVLRYMDVASENGQELTGLGSMDGLHHIFKEQEIFELDFTTLELTKDGGDWTLRRIVDGYGCIASRTLVNTGPFYIFLSGDGIRMLSVARRSNQIGRIETKIISTKIEPIIKDIIKDGTQKNCSAFFYPKRYWYIFSYEDSKKMPKGKANSILVYDLTNGNWYPFNGLLINSFANFSGTNESFALLLGDSTDGYVYYGDDSTSANDARKEIVIDVMDSTQNWKRGNQNVGEVKEGTASIRMTLPTTLMFSSITYMAVIDIGKYQNNISVSKSDLLNFKVYVTSISNFQSLRIDILLNDLKDDFDINFTSVTISSSGFINNGWQTINVAISSFVILSTWTALDEENLPFADSLTWYGIRFVSTGIGGANISIDDLRIVQFRQSPMNAYRFTKQFDLGMPIEKTFYRLVLNSDISNNNKFNIDIFKNFGEFIYSKNFSGNIPNELFVTAFSSSENLYKLSSIDFAIITSTIASDRSAFSFRSIIADDKHVFTSDEYNGVLYKIDRSSLGVIISTYGGFGSGTTSFNNIRQIALDEKYLFICDFYNNRVKVHSKENLLYVTSFGQLGKNTTSFHTPSGVAVDDTYLYVLNEGNKSLLKLTKSTGGFVSSTLLNLNIASDATLVLDKLYLYLAYNVASNSDLDYNDIVLEKRFKTNLNLIDKIIVRPENVNQISISSYTLMGDITSSDKYLFLSFSDNFNWTGNYYIQKLLKENFKLVKEYRSLGKQYSLAHNGISYLPERKQIETDLGVTGNYIQLNFWEDGLDNNFKLYNFALKFMPHTDK